MHRIDGPGATVDHKFTEGNPATAVAATTVTDDWLNAVQEEVASVIEFGGGALDKNNNAQLLAKIQSLIAAAIPSNVPQGIRGAFSNLKASATGLSAAVSVTVDELTLENGSSAFRTLAAVSITPSFANAPGINGMDVGAAGSQAASTWYYVWAIWNGTTLAGLLSLSSTAPTMPAGYTYKALVSVVRTDSTANKYPISFIQAGLDWQYKPAAGSNLVGAVPQVASGSTSSTVTAIGLTAVVPPIATAVDVLASLSVANGNVGVGPSNAYTILPARLANPSASAAANSGGRRFVLESTNIYWSSNASDGAISILGFKLGLGG